MYVKKLEYFQDCYKEGDLISGLSTRVVACMPVGSPCFVSLSQSLHRSSKGSKPKISAELQELVGAGNIDKAHEGLKRLFDSLHILFLFSMNNDNLDYLTASLNSGRFCCVEKKPLIYDAHSSISLEEAGQIAHDSANDSHMFVSHIISQLKEVRFTNYTFNNVSLSNVKNVICDIESIIASLAAIYPNSVSFYHSPWAGCRALIDTVSISFYRLSDVVPIFNHRRSEGLCMEILLTSSEMDKGRIVRSEMSMTYRFLFAKYRENIFSIDGQPIKRSHDYPVLDVAKTLYKKLKEYVPNDMAEKKVKRSKKRESKKVGGSETCAEL